MNPRISIFGGGYVGCVSAACLSTDEFQSVIVDIDPAKVDAVNAGRAPIFEPGLQALVEDSVSAGRLSASLSAADGVRDTDISLVCVGTPSREDGTLKTDYVEQCSREIGAAIARKDTFHHVVMRSTILPGTMESIVIPALEESSGMRAGIDFGVGYYPEFLRESTAIKDYYKPGAVVFGKFGDDERTVDILRSLLVNVPVEPHVISMRDAEIVKYINNCWHANKISFANEVGNLCKAAGVDSHVVMDVVCADTHLNVSSAYMKPGYAYGGSCLPKDLRALRAFGRENGVETPMLDASARANEVQVQRAYDMIRETGAAKVGMIGLTFKGDTDDLRESPLVILAERLVKDGVKLRIYDPNVVGEKGGRGRLNGLADFVDDAASATVAHGDVIVIGNNDAAAQQAMSAINGDVKTIVDLARIARPDKANLTYRGLCW